MVKIIIKVWNLFPDKYRRQTVPLVFMMVIAALLEMMGIGLLFPVIRLMQDPQLMQSNQFLSALSVWLGQPSRDIFFSYMLVALLLFFLFKNIFLFLLARFQYNFASGVQTFLSTKMFTEYLYRPYTFHLEVNTANLIRDVTTNSANVLNQIMIPLIALVSECFVISSLFVLIVYIDPTIAFLSLFFGGLIVFAIFYMLRKSLAKIGNDILIDSGKMIQYAKQGLGGVKEIKILGREIFFVNLFAKYVVSYTSNIKNVMVLNTIPRLVLDMLVIIIFIVVLLTLITVGRLNDALPIMTIYAASAFRLLPAMNRILGSLNAINIGSASLDNVTNCLAVKSSFDRLLSSHQEENYFKESIKIENVSYVYPSERKKVINNISLEIKKGEMVGFIGKSGSGKTTLIDIILGLHTPSEGRVLVDGVNIELNLGEWQHQIGYIPQFIYLTDDTLRRNIAFGLPDKSINDAGVWSALKIAQLEDVVRALPDGLDTVIGELGIRLSGGQRQRIGIARAMYHNPEVIVLDEATSSLDEDTEDKMMRAILSLHHKKTILIIAHRTSTLKSCDKIFNIDNRTLNLK